MTLLRFSPIVLEFIGTVLVWLDAVHLNARNPPKAFNIGDAPGYDAVVLSPIPHRFLLAALRDHPARLVPFAVADSTDRQPRMLAGR
jgi:hypothetical protein